MKIFTNGASFAAGSFPQMIADHYNAELTNIATVGYSNRSIWRTTIEYQPKEYDLAVLVFILGDGVYYAYTKKGGDK